MAMAHRTMRQRLLLTGVVLCLALQLMAQTDGSPRPQFGERPKLVVGIVVDQMRWDYLA